MKFRILSREFRDRCFTGSSILSVCLMVIVLVVVLSPMLFRGLKAVFFYGTNEFREMQLAVFGHGDSERLRRENGEIEEARLFIYEAMDRFRQGIDTDHLTENIRDIYRDYGGYLRDNGISGDRYSTMREKAKTLRDTLQDAFESQDKQIVQRKLQYVLELREDPDFKGTVIEKYFKTAERYVQIAETINLTRRDRYAEAYDEIKESLRKLFGPGPGESVPALTMDQYGATRWDVAQQELRKLLWIEEWVETEPGQPMVKRTTARKEFFANTELEPVFDYIETNLIKLFQPRFAFYWRYFFDESTDGHYFGGCGPEILGTLSLTVFSMLYAIPLGIISAAYLVECSSDNIVIRMIRTCINTLAGVPSIVFGLFGMAFFVLFLFPRIGQFGYETLGIFSASTADKLTKPNILAASITLGLLVLPVIIRASEEAIRAVPRTYKEAALALGAGKFRTFVTVILPAAAPGIITGIILSLSRAAGETAPILFTGAIAFGPIPHSILEPTRALSYGSYDIAVGDRLAMLVPHNQYGMVMTLIVLVLCLNIFAIWIRSRSSRKLRGL
jgi:phosphate transport system permease protein